MTALSKYSRLETLGHWTPAQGQPAREVVVAFGDATIVLSESAGQPLSHWSLPAVIRLNPGVMPALFTPDPEGTETLEIDDTWVIEAIEKIQTALNTAPRKKRKLRGWFLGGGIALLLAAGALAPSALRMLAGNLVPFSKEAEIGATLLGQLQVTTAPSCRDTFGVQVLNRLQTRVLGPQWRGALVVMPQGVKGVQVLPGQTVLISRETLASASEPAVLAGALLAALSAPDNSMPLQSLLKELPFTATLALLTQGDLPFDALRHIAADYTQRNYSLASPATLSAQFAAADVPLAPWASAQNLPEIAAADPFAGSPPPVVLSDNEWVGLLGICT